MTNNTNIVAGLINSCQTDIIINGKYILLSINLVGFSSFLMYANRTQIQGIALDPDQPEQTALAPISRIALTTAIDYYAGNKLEIK